MGVSVSSQNSACCVLHKSFLFHIVFPRSPWCDKYDTAEHNRFSDTVRQTLVSRHNQLKTEAVVGFSCGQVYSDVSGGREGGREGGRGEGGREGGREGSERALHERSLFCFSQHGRLYTLRWNFPASMAPFNESVAPLSFNQSLLTQHTHTYTHRCLVSKNTAVWKATPIHRLNHAHNVFLLML